MQVSSEVSTTPSRIRSTSISLFPIPMDAFRGHSGLGRIGKLMERKPCIEDASRLFRSPRFAEFVRLSIGTRTGISKVSSLHRFTTMLYTQSTSIRPFLKLKKMRPKGSQQTDVPAELEHAIRQVVHAVNTRDFSVSSPIWSAYCLPDFTSELVAPQVNVRGPIFTNLAGHLDAGRQTCLRYPEYKIEILEVTSHVNYKALTATTFTRHAIHGHPPGVVTENMGVSNFQFTDGKWLMKHYRGAIGLAGVPSMDGLVCYDSHLDHASFVLTL